MQTQPQVTAINYAKPLKKAHFILPQIATICTVDSNIEGREESY